MDDDGAGCGVVVVFGSAVSLRGWSGEATSGEVLKTVHLEVANVIEVIQLSSSVV